MLAGDAAVLYVPQLDGPGDQPVQLTVRELLGVGQAAERMDVARPRHARGEHDAIETMRRRCRAGCARRGRHRRAA